MEMYWTKADIGNTKIANILHGAPFKLLIPAKFGGGYIKDHYLICGKISDGKGNQYDIYELLAFWNAHMPFKGRTVGDYLLSDAGQIPMKPVDIFTNTNRRIGMAIACYDDQMDALDFPLKLVSWSYKGTYEDCQACSYSDPNQGVEKLSWKAYDHCKVKYRQLHLPVEEGDVATADECPMGGDIANDCADCDYAGEYHFVNGECVARGHENTVCNRGGDCRNDCQRCAGGIINHCVDGKCVRRKPVVDKEPETEDPTQLTIDI